MQTTAIFSIGCLGPYLKFSNWFSGGERAKNRKNCVISVIAGVISAIVVASALEFVALPT